MKKHPTFLLPFFALILCASSAMALEFTASPIEALVDQPVTIEVHELTPNQCVEIRTSTADAYGDNWTASATFPADANGNVLLNSQAPEFGSYNGIDGMGLFWSMQSDSATKTFKTKKDALEVNLQLYVDGIAQSQMTLTRLMQFSNIKQIPISKDGIFGIFYLPPSKKPLPVIIVLNGSKGGLLKNRAQLIASHGFAVLALGYFGMGNLPQTLSNIPLEYFQKTFSWLQSRKDIDGKHLGIYGISRGAELALLLGSFFPESVTAIAAIVPSSVVYPGICSRDTWTYQGKPVLPAVAPIGCAASNQDLGYDAAHPIINADNLIQGMHKNWQDYNAAAIPVERITCPVMLVSGGDDKMWPSKIYVEQIKSKLNANIPCIDLHYPNAGHKIGVPFVPAAATVSKSNCKWYTLGGTAQEDDKASRDSWQKMIEFFQQNLKSSH